MSTTIHARAADQFANHLQETDTGRRSLAQYQQMLDDPPYREFTAAVGQPYSGWTIGQIAALGRVHTLLHTGCIDAIRIRLGVTPSQDAARDANRAKLQQLPKVFTTKVYDGLSHDGDGMLGWVPEAAADIPGGWANSAALEIGHTDASRTFLHLAESGVVARWPYHSEDIWLFGFTSLSSWAAWQTESFAFLLEDGADQ